MSLPAADNFNRADSGSLGANWGFVTAGSKIVSNQAITAASSNESHDYWSADAFANDHYSQLTTINNATDNGPAVRCASGAKTSYFVRLLDGQVFKMIAASYTALGAAMGSFAAGTVAKITVVGTTIEVFKNGVSQGTRTDSGLTSGSAGLWSWFDGSTLDDWSGDNIGAASVQVPYQPQYLWAPVMAQ